MSADRDDLAAVLAALGEEDLVAVLAEQTRLAAIVRADKADQQWKEVQGLQAALDAVDAFKQEQGDDGLNAAALDDEHNLAQALEQSRIASSYEDNNDDDDEEAVLRLSREAETERLKKIAEIEKEEQAAIEHALALSLSGVSMLSEGNNNSNHNNNAISPTLAFSAAASSNAHVFEKKQASEKISDQARKLLGDLKGCGYRPDANDSVVTLVLELLIKRAVAKKMEVNSQNLLQLYNDDIETKGRLQSNRVLHTPIKNALEKLVANQRANINSNNNNNSNNNQ